MTAVVRWSGREAQALRLAQRMSVREFAAHLGVTDAAVSNWERRQEQTRLRYHTQQLLDTDLHRARPEVRERFSRALAQADPVEGAATEGACGDQEAAAAASTRTAAAAPATALGRESAMRTAALLEAFAAGVASALRYVPPAGAVDQFMAFLSSSARVFVIKGPPGCGKTWLTRHLAVAARHAADLQLLNVDLGGNATSDLPSEILRYASIPPGADPLLALEYQVSGLNHPCVVVIDGISSQEGFDRVARQVEVILRQAISDRLRFMFVLRTPPDIELAAHPVLSASTHKEVEHGADASCVVTPWTLSSARTVWDLARSPSARPFRDLPSALQQLLRVPLYMHLVHAAGLDGPSDDVDPLRLIDRCVRRILRATTPNVDAIVAQLEDLAALRLPQLLLDSIADRDGHRTPDRVSLEQAAQGIVEVSSDGDIVFVHDVLAEFFVAARLANSLREHGASLAVTASVNELASRASSSANARGVLDLVTRALDSSSPDLLSMVATAANVSTTFTLPFLMRLAGDGARFATTGVIRSCARRCEDEPVPELVSAMLTGPTVTALGSGFPAWMVRILIQYGSTIWNDMATLIERTMDRDAAGRLLLAADLEDAGQAIFFARYFFLFPMKASDAASASATAPGLVDHPDWRVRAALAEGLRDERSPHAKCYEQVLAALVRDRDYKVRAAAALALPFAEPATALGHLSALLLDENWHVRERTLQGVLDFGQQTFAQAVVRRGVVDLLLSEDSWRRCPTHIEPLVRRLLFLSGHSYPEDDCTASVRALMCLLKEINSGWLRVSDEVCEALKGEALRSRDMLLVREALVLDRARHQSSAEGSGPDPTRRRESFRRLRGGRSLQLALDVHDLGEALRVSAAVARAGVDFLEVGDPLIKRAGLQAIRRIKEQAPHLQVIAEMMSADWGRDQVVLAAESGADVVLLIGPASTASVSAAAGASRRLGVPLMLDASPTHASASWIKDMERAGVDAFAVTTNIDLGIGGQQPLEAAATIRSWTQLPVAVSGGFSPADPTPVRASDWDILIVGRSVTDALDPASAAKQVVDLVHGT